VMTGSTVRQVADHPCIGVTIDGGVLRQTSPEDCPPLIAVGGHLNEIESAARARILETRLSRHVTCWSSSKTATGHEKFARSSIEESATRLFDETVRDRRKGNHDDKIADE
jgi:hypothetical protein